jgi:glycosyltransferase involved in cell wall biosynthesis
MISVLILTKNEELNIARCLESVRWSDDIVVLDDHSTDRTVQIARRLGARVIVHSAGNERQQRTYSLRQIKFRHPWVYNPDADELTPDDLRDEMLAVVADSGRPEVAYRVRFKNLFMGRWIKHSSLYPTWVMRLFRPEKIQFERTTNLAYLADGPVGRLKAHFVHDSFHRGMRAWLEKHVRYAHYEAMENLKHLAEGRLDWRGLFCRDPVRRRAALKQLSFRLPCRPLLRFVYMYFLRRGFLDGRAGYTYCRLVALYEQMIVFQRDDLARRQQTAEPASLAEVAIRRAA